MYAALAIGHKWNAGVLLDSDASGKDAKKKISDLYLSKLAEEDQNKFRVLMLDKAAGIKKTDAAIEDLPDETAEKAEKLFKNINKAFEVE